MTTASLAYSKPSIADRAACDARDQARARIPMQELVIGDLLQEGRVSAEDATALPSPAELKHAFRFAAHEAEILAEQSRSEEMKMRAASFRDRATRIHESSYYASLCQILDMNDLNCPARVIPHNVESMRILFSYLPERTRQAFPNAGDLPDTLDSFVASMRGLLKREVRVTIAGALSCQKSSLLGHVTHVHKARSGHIGIGVEVYSRGKGQGEGAILTFLPERMDGRWRVEGRRWGMEHQRMTIEKTRWWRSQVLLFPHYNSSTDPTRKFWPVCQLIPRG